MSETADVRLAAPAASTAASGAAAASDWLRSARRTWDAVTRLLASSRFSSAFFALLPSFYCIGVLIYVNAQLAKDCVACVATASAASGAGYAALASGFAVLVSSLTSLVGALAGVAFSASLASLLAIYMKWPGVLSFWTWTAEVIKDWLLVTYIIFLFSWQSVFSASAGFVIPNTNAAFVASFSYCTVGIMVSVMLPAILVWQLAVSVVTRQRMIFSGE